MLVVWNSIKFKSKSRILKELFLKNLERILLSGGGTGGHIYPALALADQFKKELPDVKIEFVGSKRGLESKIIPSHNYKLHQLRVGQLHSSVGFLKRIFTLLGLPFVFLHCLWILLRFRPQLVMGFGGYASGPIVFVASLLFIPTAIWEANVQPGMANKILSFFVKHCFVVFEESLSFFPKHKSFCFGYPVRSEFEKIYSEKIKSPNFSVQKKNVLIFGGSQGAQVLNKILPLIAKKFPDFNFALQTGLKNYETFTKSTDGKITNLSVYPFLDPIVDFYKRADLVICRSGAGAMAELSAMGAYCLFVPFPHASDNHQFKNAKALVQRQAAFVIEEKQLSVEVLSQFLKDFSIKPADQQRQVKQKMLDFFKPEATAKIVKTLLGA